MYVLKTNTATRIPVGPLVDPTDGKTAETALTVTDLSVQLYKAVNDGGAVVRTQFAPTASGGNNDMALVTSSTDGMYDLELTATQLNFLGNARITFYDVDGFLVHWIDLHVVSAAYFDWMYGSTIPAVNATQVSGDSTAADILELFAEALDQSTGQLDSGSLAAGTLTATAIANDAITADKIAAGAIDAATFAADVDAEILSYLVDDATRIDASALNTASGTSIPAILADTGTDGVVVAAASKTGYTLTATTGLGNQTANITGNLSGSVGSVTGAVGSVTGAVGSVTGNVGGNVTGSVGSVVGHTAQTGDSFARLGAPAGASVSADVAAVKAQTAAIEADTQDLQTQVGTAGAGLTALPWNAAWDVEVQSECADALNAYDPPTKAELDSAVANVSVDEIQASALADLFNTDSGTTYAAAVSGSVVSEIADNAGGSALTTGGIADAVWDEALAGHAGAGSAGAALSAAGTAGDPWITSLPGAYGSGSAGNILGNRLVGTIASGTHNAQSGDAYARLGAPAGASVSADVAAVKSDTAAVLADTGTDGVVVAAASKTGYTLTATTGLGNQTANITGNLSGSVGSVTGAVGSVTGNVGGNVVGSVGSVTAGVTLANDAITSAKFDESTAFPLTSIDTGATRVARTGADSDTLETISDQLDAAVLDGVLFLGDTQIA